MKKVLFLVLLALCMQPVITEAAPATSFDINAGTQGVGFSLGYQIDSGVRLRLRGALLNYSTNDTWSDTDAQLKLYGNNIGLLVDFFPGQGKFYISAGVNFSENKMRCRSRIYREPGKVGLATVGGTEYSVREGDYADITGKYAWNHAQPYIGIGYQDSLMGSTTFYYSLDIGVNFMGTGKLSVGSSDNLNFRDPADNVVKPVSSSALDESIRTEARDFFKIADDLCVYPVLQLGVGARF